MDNTAEQMPITEARRRLCELLGQPGIGFEITIRGKPAARVRVYDEDGRRPVRMEA